MALSKEQVDWLKRLGPNLKKIEEVPKELLTEEFCLEAVWKNGSVLQYIPEALRTEALCIAAVKQNGTALKYVPKAQKTEAVCLAAVQVNGRMLKHVPDKQKTEAVCLKALQYGGVLQDVPDALKTEAICLEALQYGGVLQDVPDTLKTEAICLAAVQENGMTLKYVPEALRTEAICLAAVQEDGMALEYVPDALKTEAICAAALFKDKWAKQYIPKNLLAKAEHDAWAFNIENHLNYHPWLRGIYDEARNIAALDPSTVLAEGLSGRDLANRADTIRYDDYNQRDRNVNVTAVPEDYFKFLYLFGGFKCRSVNLSDLGGLRRPNNSGMDAYTSHVTGPDVYERVILATFTSTGRSASTVFHTQYSYLARLRLGRCDHGEYVYDRRSDSYSLIGFGQTTDFGCYCGDMLSHAMYRARENIEENWTAPITSGSGKFGYGLGLV